MCGGEVGGLRGRGCMLRKRGWRRGFFFGAGAGGGWSEVSISFFVLG